MLKKMLKNIIIGVIILSSISVQAVFAAEIENTNERYITPISIGFTSMKNIKSINFNITDDYIIPYENIILNGNINYNIQIMNNELVLLQNEKVILKSSQNFVIKPLNTESFISFSKEGYVRKFRGSMEFKKNGENSFIPINTINMEEYLKGVLPFEMSNTFPYEALKAQAVAARTYAVANKGKFSIDGFDLTDDTLSQVYRGFVPSADKCNNAVDETKGKVITFNGNPINAYFSSSNGGYMERNDYVWNGEKLPYLVEEEDEYDKQHRNWIETRSNKDISDALNNKYPSLNAAQFINIDLDNIQKYPSGRISEIPIFFRDKDDTQKIFLLTKDKARTFFGLKSSLFDVKVEKDPVTLENKYIFTGNGYGHGIGMSQWGAYERAKVGQTFDEILAFYYKNTVIESYKYNNDIAQFFMRIGGVDRFETSLFLAEKTFNGEIDNVVVSSGNNFPDALSGAVLAKKLNTTVILGGNTTADNSKALEYIKFHLRKDGYIYILGGESVIPNSFKDDIVKMGYNENNIIRIGGTDRYKTSLLISQNLKLSKGTPLILTSGEDFPDALSISSIAASKGWPILLTGRDKIDESVLEYIRNLSPEKIYIIGGTGAITDKIKDRVKQELNCLDDKIIRVGGKDRYETSKLVNSLFYTKLEQVIVTSGKNFPDALSGSVFAAKENSPIILADSKDYLEAQKYIEFAMQDNTNIKITALGLYGAVSDDIINSLEK